MGKKKTVEKGLYITVAGEQFPIRRVDTSWVAMKLGVLEEKALRTRPHPEEMDNERFGKNCERCEKVLREANDAASKMLGVMYKALMVLVVPEYRDDFEDYLDTTALEPGELQEAIGEAIALVAGEPVLVDAEAEGKAQEEA